jgi:hypothetical protein
VYKSGSHHVYESVPLLRSTCGAKPEEGLTTNKGETMAEEYNEYEMEDEDYGSGTDLVKKLRKQIDALQKQVKERDEILAEYTTLSHEASVGEILESFGLNPRIAQFIPDDIEADEDAVAEWLNEYGEAFGIEAIEEEGTPSPDAQAFEQMSGFDDGDVDPYVGNDLASRIANAGSPEELSKLLKG